VAAIKTAKSTATTTKTMVPIMRTVLFERRIYSPREMPQLASDDKPADASAPSPNKVLPPQCFAGLGLRAISDGHWPTDVLAVTIMLSLLTRQ
jgi:hypothetical protein